MCIKEYAESPASSALVNHLKQNHDGHCRNHARHVYMHALH